MAKNLTYRKPAKASSSMASFGPQGAVDGAIDVLSNQSRWVSNGQDPGEWLEVDLLYYCSVSSFSIFNGNNTGTDIQNLVSNMDVQIQQDGDWHTVAQIRGNTKSQIDVIMNNPVITSKVRLFFPIGEAQFRIFEFIAYGEQSNYKRADRYPQKNKFSVKKFDAEKYIGGGTLWEYDLYLKPNTKYTFSTNAPYIDKGYANVYADGVSTGSAGVTVGQPRTVTTNSEGKTRLFVRNENTTDPSDATQKVLSGEYWIQIEEGTVATPYEEYRLDHKPAILYPLENLIKPFTAWSLVDEPTTHIISDYKMQTSTVAGINSINVPVKNATQYTFSVLNPGSAIYFIDSYDANGANLTRHTDPAGNRNELLTFTTHSKASYVRIIFRNSGATGKFDTWENPKLQLGGIKTPFVPYKEGNKPAKLYPGRNQLPFDPAQWTLRNGTTSAVFEGNRITYDGNADYAGVQIMLDDKKFVGRTVTFGGDHHPDANVLFFYKKADGSGAYIGLASYESYRTITIPSDASECRFYTQNNPGTKGEFWCENVFVNMGTDPVFEPYKKGNKQAVKYPGKNLLKGSTPANVAVTKQSDYSFTIDTSSAFSFTAFENIKVLPNTKYTLSYDKVATINDVGVGIETQTGTLITNASGPLPYTFDTGNNTVIRIRFWRVQATGAKILIENWQLEPGTAKTAFEKYKETSKPLLK